MKKLSNYLDNKKVILAILLIVSILTLLICSKNSPLYPYNDWVDGNAFFTFYALLISVLTLAIISGSISFVQGGSAEEFCLPFVASSVYFFIKIINENDFGKKYLLINGAIAGCVSLIKFNLLGLWFIWMALYFFKGNKKSFYKLCLFFSGNVYSYFYINSLFCYQWGIKRLL